MRKFDVKAVDSKLSQYWSALGVTGNNVTAQVTQSAFSNINFTSNPLLNNRNIVSDSASSIQLGGRVGTISGPNFSDFGVSMVVLPEVCDVWVMKFNTGIGADSYIDSYSDSYTTDAAAANVGVKVNSDSTISLVWTQAGAVAEQKIVFAEAVGFLSLTKQGTSVSLQHNNQLVTIEGDDYDFTGWTMGGGAGNVLVDKIAFSITGNLPTARQYFELFRSQRLDNVSRPNAKASFTYVNDIREAIVKQIDQEQFYFEDGYFYATYQNLLSDGVWSIDKRAAFQMEYSIDQGANWLAMPVKLNLPTPYTNILFRHNTESDQNYYIEIRTSGAPEIPLAFFDTAITGSLHLPGSVGQGYYDVDYARFDQAQLVITPQSDTAGIRTVEFLGSNLVLPGAPITYINGKDRALSSMVDGQIYHVVAVYDTPQTSITLNAFEISGVGASELAYTESDAYFIYNVFAGNTFVSALETIGEPVDGLAPNAIGSNAASALSVQWNS